MGSELVVPRIVTIDDTTPTGIVAPGAMSAARLYPRTFGLDWQWRILESGGPSAWVKMISGGAQEFPLFGVTLRTQWARLSAGSILCEVLVSPGGPPTAEILVLWVPSSVT